MSVARALTLFAAGSVPVALMVSGLHPALAAPAGTTPAPTFLTAPQPTIKRLPLQKRSTVPSLGERGRARLPEMRRWATAVIGDGMDQPNGLMGIQVVSTLHIYRAFTHRFGVRGAASAVLISWRESRLLPNVVNDLNRNRTWDWGLFQLNDGGTLQTAGGRPGRDALRPRWNARAASRLVRDYGWDPWGGPLNG